MFKSDFLDITHRLHARLLAPSFYMTKHIIHQNNVDDCFKCHHFMLINKTVISFSAYSLYAAKSRRSSSIYNVFVIIISFIEISKKVLKSLLMLQKLLIIFLASKKTIYRLRFASSIFVLIRHAKQFMYR